MYSQCNNGPMAYLNIVVNENEFEIISLWVNMFVFPCDYSAQTVVNKNYQENINHKEKGQRS